MKLLVLLPVLLLASVVLVGPAMAADPIDYQSAETQITDIWYELSAAVVGLSLVMSIIIIVKGKGSTSHKQMKMRQAQFSRAGGAVGKASKSVRSDFVASAQSVRKNAHIARADWKYRAAGRRKL